MNEFKVGDIVVVVDGSHPFYSAGDLGRVIEVGIHCYVDFRGFNNRHVEGDGHWYALPSRLKLAEEQNYTVFGLYPESYQRFAFIIAAESADQAEVNARNQYGADILIAGTVFGSVCPVDSKTYANE